MHISIYLALQSEDEISDLDDYDHFLLDETPTTPFIALSGSMLRGSVPSASKPLVFESSNSMPPFRNLSDRPPTAFDAPTVEHVSPIPPPLRWEQTFLFTPFLEETHS